MHGHEHYREAERLLDFAEEHALENGAEWYANAMAAAQVHATLSHAAAVIEAADQQIDKNLTQPLVVRPHPGDEVDPPYPGTPWGRAFHGDRHLTPTTTKD